MIDGIAIRSYRVGLAASQFSVALCKLGKLAEGLYGFEIWLAPK